MIPLVREMRARRRGIKVTQEALGKRAGVGHVSIQNWERGANEPTLSNFEAVVEALGGRVKIEWPAR